MAKVALAKLRRVGGVYVHGRSDRRRIYRLCDPEVLIYILSGKITNLCMFKQGRYCRLIGLASIGILRKISNVRSIVVYGSVARGTAGEDSDVDMLVIMEGVENLGERLDKLLKVESIDRIGEELDWLYRNGASMLEQAYSRLKMARTAIEDKNYAYTVRSSQECVELSLKAALRLIGVEYPKRHDVSRVILMNKERFPEWFTVEEFAEISRALAEKREPAMYGIELGMMSASKLFDERQAGEALKDAEHVYDACMRLLREVKLKMNEGEIRSAKE